MFYKHANEIPLFSYLNSYININVDINKHINIYTKGFDTDLMNKESLLIDNYYLTFMKLKVES
jgi:hypothetical protein